jgi:hypothetical protein
LKKISIEITKPEEHYNNAYDVCAITNFDGKSKSGGVYRLDDFFKDLKRHIGNLESQKVMNDNQQRAVDNILEDLRGHSSVENREILREVIEVKLGGKL